MAAGSPAVAETVQVGLCSGRAGVPFLVGIGTRAFTGFRHLLGSFSSARQRSSSCKLCWLVEQKACSVLPDEFGEAMASQPNYFIYVEAAMPTRTSTWAVSTSC